MGLPLTRSTQRENLRNNHIHYRILKLPRTVPPMLIHLQAQNHVRTVARCILQEVCFTYTSDANTNEKIIWKESETGKNIIQLKGTGATLDIQQRYDGASDRMGPVDDATLRKFFRSKRGETVLNNVNTTLITTATAMDEDQHLPRTLY